MNLQWDFTCPKCSALYFGDVLLGFCPNCFIELNKFEVKVNILLLDYGFAPDSNGLVVYPAAMATAYPS